MDGVSSRDSKGSKRRHFGICPCQCTHKRSPSGLQRLQRLRRFKVTSSETIQVHQRFQEADSSSKVSTAPEVIDPQRETQGPMRLMQCSSRDRIGVQVPRYSTPL